MSDFHQSALLQLVVGLFSATVLVGIARSDDFCLQNDTTEAIDVYVASCPSDKCGRSGFSTISPKGNFCIDWLPKSAGYTYYVEVTHPSAVSSDKAKGQKKLPCNDTRIPMNFRVTEVAGNFSCERTQ